MHLNIFFLCFILTLDYMLVGELLVFSQLTPTRLFSLEVSDYIRQVSKGAL